MADVPYGEPDGGGYGGYDAYDGDGGVGYDPPGDTRTDEGGRQKTKVYTVGKSVNAQHSYYVHGLELALNGSAIHRSDTVDYIVYRLHVIRGDATGGNSCRA